MVEVTVSKRCEHESFTIQLGSPAVWHLAGAPVCEADAEDFFVFHQNSDPCECWEYDNG